MRNIFKPVCLLIVLCISILVLSSCSSNSNTNKTTATEVPATEVVEKTTEVPTEKPTTAPTATPKKTSTSSSSSSKSSYSSSSSSFTNKYGTATTKCAHPGCNNYIASSGDTNCCTTHSRKCLECGKYIDEDATYCMDCIRKAAGQVAKDNGKKCDDSGCSNTASKALTVTQPSGESASFYLCSTHYSEYKKLFNSKPGWKAE